MNKRLYFQVGSYEGTVWTAGGRKSVWKHAGIGEPFESSKPRISCQDVSAANGFDGNGNFMSSKKGPGVAPRCCSPGLFFRWALFPIDNSPAKFNSGFDVQVGGS